MFETEVIEGRAEDPIYNVKHNGRVGVAEDQWASIKYHSFEGYPTADAPIQRKRISVSKSDDINVESVFHNCTLGEVLALVRNRSLADGCKRVVRDEFGYVEILG